MTTTSDMVLDRTFTLARADLAVLFSVLAENGYEIVAPIKKDGAIVYDTVTTATELPIGWTDRQEAGRYRLEERSDNAVFGYAVGPHSWKRYLHPPERILWRARRADGKITLEAEPADDRKRAFLGVRPCELAAIDIQSRVFLDGPFKDTDYQRRRAHTLIIAVNCGTPASTCFCPSMNTGPAATHGYDVLMTEIVSPERHEFVVTAGAEKGRAILRQLPLRPATSADIDAANEVTASASLSITRSLETDGLQDFLQANPDHPQWDDVASRCLACANCTAVCPTCFCTTIEDHSDLAGAEAVRVQKQDSCFSGAFSELSGGPVRQSTKARYRQWMTHKLGTWIDQFGTSGCVGCGRCIAWCPAGIDITTEARAMRHPAEE